MTREEIIKFYNSVSSFAVPTREESDRINALSKEDRGALLDYIIEVGQNSGVYEGTVEDIWQEAKRRYAARLVSE